VSAGRRRAEKVSGPSGPSRLRRALVPLAGALVAAAAWVVLVLAAIDFGRAARGDDGASAWVLTIVAALGATLCLLLVFVLLARVWARLGLVGEASPSPRTSGGRHR
jgi:hypothetical protein